MELIISCKHFDVSDDLREFIENKLAKLEEYSAKLTSLRLVLYIERGMHIAEAHLTGKHTEFEAAARTPDMYTTIDAVSDKLERQVRRYIERKRDQHRAKREPEENIPAEIPEEENMEEKSA